MARSFFFIISNYYMLNSIIFNIAFGTLVVMFILVILYYNEVFFYRTVIMIVITMDQVQDSMNHVIHLTVAFHLFHPVILDLHHHHPLDPGTFCLRHLLELVVSFLLLAVYVVHPHYETPLIVLVIIVCSADDHHHLALPDLGKAFLRKWWFTVNACF